MEKKYEEKKAGQLEAFLDYMIKAGDIILKQELALKMVPSLKEIIKNYETEDSPALPRTFQEIEKTGVLNTGDPFLDHLETTSDIREEFYRYNSTAFSGDEGLRNEFSTSMSHFKDLIGLFNYNLPGNKEIYNILVSGPGIIKGLNEFTTSVLNKASIEAEPSKPSKLPNVTREITGLLQNGKTNSAQYRSAGVKLVKTTINEK
jgi:hypothetical protein